MIVIVPLAFALIAAPVPKLPSDQFTRDVAASRAKAIAFLKKAQGPDGIWEDEPRYLADLEGGMTAFVTWSLLEAGVPANDPMLAKPIAHLAKLPPRRTYVVSLQTRILARADPKKHADIIQKNADWLLNRASRNFRLQGWSYPGNFRADASNTHFAVLALDAAATAGAKLQKDIWTDIQEMYIRSAHKNGGWSYISEPESSPSRSMTVAGLSGLIISANHVKDANDPARQVREQGWKAFAKGDLGEPKSAAYMLVMTAELGRLTGKPVFKVGDEEIKWYVDGATALLKTQKATDRGNSARVLMLWRRSAPRPRFASYVVRRSEPTSNMSGPYNGGIPENDMNFAFAAGLMLAFAAGQPAERTVAASSKSSAAAFAARPAGETAFTLLPENSDLHTGDLLVALPGATLVSKGGAVSVKSLADYDGKSPLPVLETAFTLNAAKEVDLDLTLDRGRIDLTNLKAEGAAKVRVRFRDQTWTIALEEKGTRVAVELCGRWPAGSRFKVAKAGEKAPEPVASLVLLVVNGSATAELGGFSVGLKAPPGPALVEWDSDAGARPQPQKLEKLPEWAEPENSLSPEGKKTAAALEKFRAARAADGAAALKAHLESTDPVEQRIALVTLGATDDLEPLGVALAAAKSAEQWDFGITVVRHWLGRCAGNDQKLYSLLTSPTQGYTPVHSKTILQLLLGFTAEDVQQPETFEVLIEYLKHDQRAIRNLAAWHLVRLDPRGKAIGFKPNGTPEEFDTSYKAWKKLIPPGTLPKKS